MTQVISKQLLPIYDKPMIYYPLTTLMLAGVREILIISTPTDLPLFQRLLGDGANGASACLTPNNQSRTGWRRPILSGRFRRRAEFDPRSRDNVFYGHGLPTLLRTAASREKGASVFAYHVTDPNVTAWSISTRRDARHPSKKNPPSPNRTGGDRTLF